MPDRRHEGVGQWPGAIDVSSHAKCAGFWRFSPLADVRDVAPVLSGGSMATIFGHSPWVGERSYQTVRLYVPLATWAKEPPQMSMKEIGAVLRDWQFEAEQAELDYLREGGTRPLLAACPGAGKTTYGVRRACRFFNQENGQLVIVVAPTTNIKLQWIKAFRRTGCFKVTGNVENSLIRDRLENAECIKSEYEVIVVTYAQLAKEPELFRHYPDRYTTLVIADEVHHADDQAAFGNALTRLADAAQAHLALSGTPFNSEGGALAMCDSEPTLEDGKQVRRTIPFYTYTYGKALADKNKVCRVIEFGITHGKATTTYQSLVTGDTFDRITEGKRKTDSLRPFLDTEGEFLPTLLEDAIQRFDAVKAHHRRAAMLVVAQDTTAAAEIEKMLFERCGSRYSIQRIVHDTEKAHERIERLPKDNTDIVVTVRMISEGIDVHRFRVGVFAADYTTQMFFIQFVGRFVRWDTDLGDGQCAWLLFPGHVKLIEYARDIEKMIIDSTMALGLPGGEAGPSTLVRTATASEVTDRKTMARGATLEADDDAILKDWLANNPDMSSKYGDHVIVDILKRAYRTKPPETANLDDTQRIQRKKNEQTVWLVCRLMKKNGSGVDDERLYASVNGRANRAVGIRKVDNLTPENVLERRLAFLNTWAKALIAGADPESFEYE